MPVRRCKPNTLNPIWDSLSPFAQTLNQPVFPNRCYSDLNSLIFVSSWRWALKRRPCNRGGFNASWITSFKIRLGQIYFLLNKTNTSVLSQAEQFSLFNILQWEVSTDVPKVWKEFSFHQMCPFWRGDPSLSRVSKPRLGTLGPKGNLQNFWQ